MRITFTAEDIEAILLEKLETSYGIKGLKAEITTTDSAGRIDCEVQAVVELTTQKEV
jgi:hypothetical protein